MKKGIAAKFTATGKRNKRSIYKYHRPYLILQDSEIF